MILRYHAWLRDKMGCATERIALPGTVKNVGMLLDWLPSQDERFKGAFKYIDTVMISVNRQYADRDYPVGDADEVTLMPPIAGG
ncbi:MAG: MoaD/ThiS family protein [Steroidobacteraceae bacterium]